MKVFIGQEFKRLIAWNRKIEGFSYSPVKEKENAY
jgi:hypothetical protein